MKPRTVGGDWTWRRRLGRWMIGGMLVLGLPGMQGVLLPEAVAGELLLSMQARVGNPGDTVEVALNLEYDKDALKSATAPSSISMELLFDPEKLRIEEEYFELIMHGANGQVLQDAHGHADYRRGPFRVGEPVLAAEKQVKGQVFAEEGRFRIVIMGLNNNPIAPGRLLTFAVRIHPDHQAGESLLIMGNMHETSVANPQAQPLAFAYEDAIIATGCEGPKAPEGLQAVSGLRNGVELSWQAVGGAQVSYRVYRSREHDRHGAKPLGDRWIDGTAFMDYTALPADSLDVFGCNKPAQVEEVPYYYWVRARNADGCPGAWSAAVEGARGAYKENRNVHAAIADGALLRDLGRFVPLGIALFLIGAGRRRAVETV